MRPERYAPLARVGIAFALTIVSFVILTPHLSAQINVAHDDASSSAYNSGWTNGQASGTGFSNWTLQLPAGSSAGVASSSDNDFGDIGNANINTAGRALRLVSSNVSTAADALRTFTAGPLQVGQVFTIWTDNGNINAGGVVGFGLQNDAGGNNRFEMYFVGGESNYTLNDNAGANSSGVGFTRGGLRVAFMLTGPDSYRMSIVRNGASSATVIGSRILSGTAGSGIDKLRIFNFNAGGNTFDNAFFTNQFDITEGFAWDGGGAGDEISRPENWRFDIPPISAAQLKLHFAGNTRLTPVFGTSPFFAKMIEFDPGAGPFVLTRSAASSQITYFEGGVTNNSSSVQTLDLVSFINSNTFPFTTTFDAGSVPGGGLQTGPNGRIDISTNVRSLIWTGSNSGTIGAQITGAGMLAKTGTGMLHMTSGITHIYSGSTTVTGGTLRVDATLGPGDITVAAGAVSVGNGTPGSGVLAGSGIISRAVNINSGGTISPGSGENGNANTIGNLTINTGGITSGTATLEGGGAYVVQVNRRADAGAPGGPGVEGVNWDKLSMSALTVNATSGNKFVVRVVSLNASFQPGPIPDWDPTVSQTWRVATVSGTVTGFDPDDFEIDLTQFTNHNTTLASFFLWQDGGDIKLTYVPEPAGLAALLLGGVALLRRVR